MPSVVVLSLTSRDLDLALKLPNISVNYGLDFTLFSGFSKPLRNSSNSSLFWLADLCITGTYPLLFCTETSKHSLIEHQVR